MRIKKSLAILLTLALMAGLLVLPAAAAFKDTEGHWAQTAIDRWSGEGVLNGYEDGSFAPDGNITRAELATVLDRLMGYISEAKNSFTDIEAAAWYSGAILRANAAGVIKGDGVTMRPNDNVTRQEAIVMLGRALGIKEDTSAISGYSDAARVEGWAAGLVGGMTKAGFVQGSEGKISPNADMTRAEAVTILNNAISAWYSKAGTYSENAAKDVIVKSAGVVLSNMTVGGDLILAEGIGSGDVTLDNVTVKGSTVVRGGGEHSIIVRGGSALANIIIQRKDGKVRVSVEGDANVEVIVVNDGSDDVKIEGTVGSVVVENTAAPVEITGTVKNLEITEAAAGAKISVAETAKVENIKIAAPEAKLEVSGEVANVEVEKTAEASNITGSGKVENVAANADNVKVETPNTKVEAGEGTTGVTAGDKPVTGGTSEETPEKKPETPPVVVVPTVSTVKTEDELKAAIAGSADIVQLGEDIVLTGTINVGRSVTLDINGKHVTSGTGAIAYEDGAPKYLIVNTGNLTIKGGGKIEFTDETSLGVVYNSGTLNAAGVTFETSTHKATDSPAQEEKKGAIIKCVAGSDTTLTDVTAQSLYDAAGYYGNAALSVENGSKRLVVSGGTYKNMCKETGGTTNPYAFIVRAEENILAPNVVYGWRGGLSASAGNTTINAGDYSAYHFYAGYFAGEKGVVQVTVNGGTFSTSEGRAASKALYVGNNIETDGGDRENANCIINGGTFIGPKNGAVLVLDKAIGTLGIRGGTFNTLLANTSDTIFDYCTSTSSISVTTCALAQDATIPEGTTLTVPANGTLTVNQGKTLTVSGKLDVLGTLDMKGVLAGTGTITGADGATLVIDAGGSYDSLSTGTYTWTSGAWIAAS